jgi:AraC-like DNA-binding protein
MGHTISNRLERSTETSESHDGQTVTGAQADMPGDFLRVEVADPHRTTRVLWETLSSKGRTWLDERQFCSLEFEALDWRCFKTEPESFRSVYWTPTVGMIRVSRIAHTRATQSVQRAPGFDSYCVSLMERGYSRLVQSRSREAVIGKAATGLVFTGEPGTRYASSDDSVRLDLWFPGKLVRERLEALLDGQKVNSVAFEPAFDQARGPGATIRHMLEFLFAELARSDSLLANPIATRSFQDNLALYLLLGLRHSHTERLQRQRATAPSNVRRAEEFMRGNTGAPLTIVEIARAAGCSVRALQVAFQRFRGTTPMAALRRIRLEEARAEMLRTGRSESIACIAAGHGFSTPSRFAQLFRRTYGIYPSEALRTQRSSGVGLERT